jgi:ketosteroid isomerase-like protein
MIVALFFVFQGPAAASARLSTSANDELEIKQTYDAWVEVTNAKDIDSWMAFLAPNALFQPPGVGRLETHADIRQYYIGLFSDPNFALVCEQIEAWVSESGEMAWATGTCRATFSGEPGEIATGASKWTKVWLKQDDGTWKCRLNTWNAMPAGDQDE